MIVEIQKISRLEKHQYFSWGYACNFTKYLSYFQSNAISFGFSSFYLFTLEINVRKHTFRHMCPAKIQISLHIHAVWSESSLGASGQPRMQHFFMHTCISEGMFFHIASETRKYSAGNELQFSTLGKNFRWHFKIFFLIFPRKQVLTFHANCLHLRQFNEMSNPVFWEK